jgi:manganese-dependent inorganic pyrophosphatase
MSLLVFGHRNPDTDAICSALAYADFLRRTTRPDAIAACCGAPNLRTEYALEKAGVESPRIVMDVRPEVEDVCRREVVFARETEVFYEVYERMKESDVSAIPIVNEKHRAIGLLTLLDLLRVVFEGDSDPLLSRQVVSTVEKIRHVLDGEFQNAVDPEEMSQLLVMVGAMSAEGFTKRLHQFPASRLIVVSGNRPTIQLPALEHGVRVLVITGNYDLSPGLLQLAKINNVTVIKSPFDTATTTMRIKSARTIQSAVRREFDQLDSKMPIEDARQKIQRLRQSLFPVSDDSGRMIGVLSKSDVVNPPKPQLVLVDHNELGQAVQGAEDADILEVLDHHRIGGSLKTSQPIKFINDPVGSTCTLVARQYRAAGMEPDPGIALCMASGIISDTLNLKSPTTTDVDRDILRWLQAFCSVDLGVYAKEFFEIGSALRTCTPQEVIVEDCKEFEEAGQHFSISQIEEIGFDLFWKRQNELLTALQEHALQRNLAFAALLITDVATNGSLLLMSSEPDDWEEINYPRLERFLYQLEGVVSRKKQLLPLITRLLQSTLNSPSIG